MALDSKLKKRFIIKFILTSLVGIFAFAIPFKYDGNINTVVGVLTLLVQNGLSLYLDVIIIIVLGTSALGSIICFVSSKLGKPIDNWFGLMFRTNIFYLLIKIAAVVIILLYHFYFKTNLTELLEIGNTVNGLATVLIAIAISLSYFLPFLTDTGFMEFSGILLRKFVRPLFKVPPDASIDLLVSWLGAANVAVLLSAEKYEKGYYTAKETATIMCNFSLVSIPFCMLVAGVAGVQQYFHIMYMLLVFLGVLLAIIMPRIYPLNAVKDDYYEKQKIDYSSLDTNINIFKLALIKGGEAAVEFDLLSVVKFGTKILINISFNLIPMAVFWATLGLIIVEYTSIIKFISFPIGVLLNLVGVEEAFIAAPSVIVGFIDMFIPALLSVNIDSVTTRFIVATLSLIQVIYITEVGIIIIQTKLGLGVGKLFLIFLERTFISLPIIIIVANILFKS